MQSPLHAMNIGRIRSAFLLVSLMMLMVTAFVLPTAPGSTAAGVMAVVYMVVFSIASYLIGARRNWLAIYLIVAACIWITGLLTAVLTNHFVELEIIRRTLLTVLKVMLVWLVFRFSMFDPHASRADRIVAGVSGYLIMAFMWANLYELNDVIQPGSLYDSLKGEINPAEGDYLYYSLITLTTTGYGEILPLTPAARLLGSLQSVAGTLYLAVFIASLLGRREKAA